ncbi:Tyrosinase [Ascochyta rabiei]|uniref:Metal ion binding n=1 Tax=Didymella rabiei TaxID=5454 RepID=A0A163B884_DIDRA|nr:Tyrosinase [Ascochyta rabiei]KZM21620.1 metal ion binding [Ascochyta rabiei]UPX17649.1 Tyrosinase [Ascochyta rabiei]
MHLSFTAAVLAVAGSAIALPQNPAPAQGTSLPANVALPPALPVTDFKTPKFARPLSLDEALAGVNATVTTIVDNLQDLKNKLPELQLPSISPSLLPVTTRDLDEELAQFEKRQSTCSNPRIRREWDSYSNSDRQAYIDAIKCLQARPASGQFRQSQSRYEDLVALHQTLTPNVHGNAKFLLWHRYYLWTFEQMLRSDCGFNRELPWFDETRYAGRYTQSSVFSSQWFGSINVGGQCVTNGQFAGLAINIGPGSGNTRHCLARDNDDSETINTGSAIVDACNSRSTYADMASCAEGGAHAWGHNGIGAVMQDTYASPADPVFFLHHAFIDRNFRIWQNNGGNPRITTVSGTDAVGNRLTLDTTVNVYDFRPTVRIRDILNTQSSTLCYKYNY